MNNRIKSFFYLSLLMVFTFLTIISIGPEIKKTIFPLIILTLSIIACIAKLVALVKPSWGKVIDPESILEGIDRSSPTPTDKEGEINKDLSNRVVTVKLSLITVILWIFLTVIIFYLVGLVVGAGISTIIYMSVICKEKWTISIVTAIFLSIAIYLGFNIALKSPLYPGLLFEKLL